jgi:hypothetical protein
MNKLARAFWNHGHGVDRRRSVPIMAYVGANGSGKTLCAIRDTLDSLRAGRTVLSTVRLLNPDTGEPWPNYVPLTDWRQVIAAQHCDILADEVTGVASSRESSRMPHEVVNKLVQLRRADCVFRWTTPSWSRADTVIREVTQAVTVCAGFAPVRGTSGLWRPHRLFRFLTFDAADMATEQFTEHRWRTSHPLCREFFWAEDCEAFRAYDTYDQVLTVGEQVESGLCLVCGGIRSPKKCKGDHTDAERAEALHLWSVEHGQHAVGGGVPAEAPSRPRRLQPSGHDGARHAV